MVSLETHNKAWPAHKVPLAPKETKATMAAMDCPVTQVLLVKKEISVALARFADLAPREKRVIQASMVHQAVKENVDRTAHPVDQALMEMTVCPVLLADLAHLVHLAWQESLAPKVTKEMHRLHKHALVPEVSLV